ncbi:MAG: hypothetical protein A3G81_25595 [Betaproteobacteria bacterium RIFCSPLOWO2_12_FULL_65_14]|nr:MAG: hypothetical protein A3G81_25595 [Betaproteobacteria bacterium RIFCSPLOWO2_12_FULL_65_14]
MTKGRRRALFLRGNALFFFALEIFAAAAISAASASVAGRGPGMRLVMLSQRAGARHTAGLHGDEKLARMTSTCTAKRSPHAVQDSRHLDVAGIVIGRAQAQYIFHPSEEETVMFKAAWNEHHTPHPSRMFEAAC